MCGRTPIKTLAILLVCLLVSACSQGLPPEMAREQAQKLLETMKAGDVQGVLALYDEQFYLARPRDQWQKELEKLSVELGAMESFALRKEHYDSRYSARFYLFEYQTLHQRGKAWQTLTIINPVGTEELQIVGHQIKR